MTILFYILTVVFAGFAITSIPVAIVGGIAGKWVGMPLAAFIGGFATWMGIGALWAALEGGAIPILALILSFGALAAHGQTSRDDLNDGARLLLVAEMWAILGVAVATMVLASSIRWF